MTKMVVSESITPTISHRDESNLITTNGELILLSKKRKKQSVQAMLNSQPALNIYACSGVYVIRWVSVT